MALPTNFRDDILKSGETKRKYKMINNPDGTISFDDVTDYQQVGSDFGAKQVNDTNTAVNDLQPAADKINNLEIGGRNLILNSGREITNNEYLLATYSTTIPIHKDETYTISMSIKVPKGVNNYSIYSGSSDVYIGAIYPGKSGEHTESITITTKQLLENSIIRIRRFPDDGSVTENTTIHWFKVEKGNIATDWTPAPEDIVDNSVTAVSKKTLGTLNEVKDATQKGFWVDALAVKELSNKTEHKVIVGDKIDGMVISTVQTLNFKEGVATIKIQQLETTYNKIARQAITCLQNAINVVITSTLTVDGSHEVEIRAYNIKENKPFSGDSIVTLYLFLA